MLTPYEIEEMKALTARVMNGSVTRTDWATLAALIVVHQGDETVAAIAEQGLDEFIRVSRPIYEGHAFQYDDFKRMFARICEAAQRYPSNVVTH